MKINCESIERTAVLRRAVRLSLLSVVFCLAEGAHVDCGAGGCAPVSARPRAEEKADRTDAVLRELAAKNERIESCSCRLEYRFTQPLFESESLRTGRFFYARSPEQSRIRVDFETLRQDEGPQRAYRESYIYDGAFLVHINYPIRQVRRYRRADPNEPDRSRLPEGIPILGLSRISHLKQQFNVVLAGNDAEGESGQVEFLLEPKPDSGYRDEFSSVTVWIDGESGLPVRIRALSIEEDIYEIRLIEPRINAELGRDTFEAVIADGFSGSDVERS
jgi:outer membrane lipoprotein-sorting protein